jgi:phosphoglycerate dehydrogenase-like enzyme
MAAWCEPELRRRLRGEYDLYAIPDARTLDRNLPLIETAHVIVGWPLTAAAARRAHNLKLLQVSGAGIDGLALDELPRGVQVCNTFHHEIAIAEYVIMAMLYLARQPHRYDAGLRRGNWTGSCIWGETPVLRELHDQTVLLAGVGHIAHEVARRACAFGMRLVGVSRNPDKVDGRNLFSTLVTWDLWEQQIPSADWVVPCCPLTPQTVGLFNARTFDLMKPSAYLINITRGPVVDEQAVYDALLERRIAGAALDVWYQYPSDPDETCLPSRLPFHKLDNVLMSPHNSAWTNRTILGRVEDIAENINRLAAGKPLQNVVR